MPRRSTSPTRINLEQGYWLDCRETGNPGTWYIYWRETDKQRRKSSTGETRRAAAEAYFRTRFLPDRQRELTQDQRTRDRDPLWDDLLDWYETEKRRAGTSPATLEVTRKIRRAVTGRTVSETDGAFWEQYKFDRRGGAYSLFRHHRSDWKHGVRAADGTLLRELRGVLAVLRLGIKAQRVHPGLLPSFLMPTEPGPCTAHLSPVQMRQLLDHALVASPPEGQGLLRRVALWSVLALCTGGRARAIECLTWDRVDLEDGWIDLQAADRKLTKKRNARVPILPELRPMLERAARERVSEYVLRNNGTVVKEWDDFIIAAVGQKFRRHDLRHSLATKMVNDGVSLGGVADFLGNTQRMVERVYAHHNKTERARREVMQHWKPL